MPSKRKAMLPFSSKIDPKTGEQIITTSLKGKMILTSPQLNKGTAFTEQERHDLNLLGKLPTLIENLEQQVDRAYQQFNSFKTNIKRNIYLNSLHDNNQVLFYALVKKHLAEMIPVIYTPIVGTAVKQFSHEYRRSRGLYISYNDRDRIEEILKNRSHPEIDVIVVTDGEGVLGIGDQGIGGMDIPIAKLMVYTLCGGLDHLRTLPICLDVGTNNKTLLNDPMYLGLKHERIAEEKYREFIKKFVKAVQKVFPWVFLHWEDFGRENARHNLDTYRQKICSFNDDIQGTGVITVAALLAAVKANKSNITHQKIVVFGAGSAGTGISDRIRDAMVHSGMSPEDAKKQFWLIDRQGLLIKSSSDLIPAQKPYARDPKECQDWNTDANGHIDLATTIKEVKPTVLLGCSAVTGAFTESIVKEMASHTEHPIIFPLSNPTERAEATAADLIDWTDGKALIATGSPFEPVNHRNRTITIAQCNNALAFPGIGMGVIATQAKHVPSKVLWAASQAICEHAPCNEDPLAPLLPSIENADVLAQEVALAVAKAVRLEKLDTANHGEDIESVIDKMRWEPSYPTIKATD